MLSVRIPEEMEKRLTDLAHKTGRTKTFYVSKAIHDFVEDMEDYYLAEQRLAELGKTFTMEEVKNALNLEN